MHRLTNSDAFSLRNKADKTAVICHLLLLS
jgi:hypothetical protein